MLFNAEIYQLKEEAIKDIKEAAQKKNRPYYVREGGNSEYIIAIPFRSNLKHNYSFITKNIENRRRGLDYSKAIIFLKTEKTKYINREKHPIIDREEYNIVMRNSKIIQKDFSRYMRKYMLFLDKQKSGKRLIKRERQMIEFSTLKNYHEELVIKKCLCD